MNVISSCTWVLVTAIGAPLSVLDPRRDMLTHVDAWGRAVACARFMGGVSRNDSVPDRRCVCIGWARESLARFDW